MNKQMNERLNNWQNEFFFKYLMGRKYERKNTLINELINLKIDELAHFNYIVKLFSGKKITWTTQFKETNKSRKTRRRKRRFIKSGKKSICCCEQMSKGQRLIQAWN